MTPSLLSRCLVVATAAAQRAGRLQAAHAGHPKTVETKRHAIDFVTEIDRESEAIIRRAIGRAFPDHGFLGEERTRANPDAPYQWIVDPLDGTTNFVHGFPLFAVSIGLVLRGRPVVGVIHDPIRRETFTAIKGYGTRLNGKRVHVTRTNTMAQSLLSTGFSITFRKDPAPFLHWFELMQRHSHAVRRIGTTAISLAWTACGRQDGFYEIDLAPWDIAAGILLVEEAGGRVTDYAGKRPRLADSQIQIIASNGRIHRDMLTYLADVPATLKLAAKS